MKKLFVHLKHGGSRRGRESVVGCVIGQLCVEGCNFCRIACRVEGRVFALYARKTCRGSGGLALPIHNPGTRRSRMVGLTPEPFYHRRGLAYLYSRRLCGPRAVANVLQQKRRGSSFVAHFNVV